jgi:hypothetical protein
VHRTNCLWPTRTRLPYQSPRAVVDSTDGSPGVGSSRASSFRVPRMTKMAMSPSYPVRPTPQISGGAFRPFCRPCRSNFCRSPAPSAASGCWTASCAFLGCPVKPGRALGAHADQTEFAESSPRTRERDQHRGRHAKPAGPLVTLGESANSWRHRTPERNREPPTPRRARHAGAALCTASRFRS